MLNFRKSKIFRLLHLVSELMVKRQPWFCWVLLIRDRVSSTLEWVECNKSYESVFVSEYKIVLYCDDWFIEWHMNFRQRGPQDYAEGVSKHLNRTIRHDIVLKINCFSSHTSHMTDSEFIVFLPKLWVPTNFHTGSQELRFIRIFWSCWRQDEWHGVLLV